MSAKDLEGLTTIVFVVGFYEGVMPFIAQLFGWRPVLSLPLRLDGPWWWIVSGLVVLVALGLLETLDREKRAVAEREVA